MSGQGRRSNGRSKQAPDEAACTPGTWRPYGKMPKMPKIPKIWGYGNAAFAAASSTRVGQRRGVEQDEGRLYMPIA